MSLLSFPEKIRKFWIFCVFRKEKETKRHKKLEIENTKLQKSIDERENEKLIVSPKISSQDFC